MLDLNVLLDNVCKLFFVVLSIFQELVLEELCSGRSAIWVLDEAARDEVLKEWAPFISDWRWVKPHNVQDDLTLALVDVRRVTIGELVGENAD